MKDAAGILKKKVFFIARCRYCQGLDFDSSHGTRSQLVKASLLIWTVKGS